MNENYESIRRLC